MSTARRAGLGLAFVLGWLVALAAPAGAAGPPFPPPVAGQNVYDEAGIWSAATEAQAERIADAIEARVGAQVVAYSQVVPEGITGDEAEQQAAALGNQWGVGRGGFDDGLVILFDIEPNGIHGQVAIVSGDGFRATYLSDDDSQRIINDQLLPLLTRSPPDFDAGLLTALEAVDRAATPEGRASLDRARIVNAVVGLVLGPILALALLGWAVFHWLRFGRDPFYLDSPSILMPAPPDQLTAATGALVYDGATSRRALTTAMLDLASRGVLAFEERHGLLSRKVAVVTNPTPLEDQVARSLQHLANRRPLSPAEAYARDELHTLGRDHAGLLEGEDLLEFGTKVDGFNERLEDHAVAQGWFRQAPRKVKLRWAGLGIAELVGAGVAFIIGVNVPISGLVLAGIFVAVAGIGTLLLARVMPARTLPGATIRAMLAAYRRTLEMTMRQARSMGEVVERAGLAWIETPDQALVWSVALGLQHEVDEVMQRSTEDLREGRASPGLVWMPGWYGAQGSGGHGGWGDGGSQFSGSGIPNVAGMVAVLGSVGNAPSSSGGGGFGGGGGFSGGSSGGF